MGNRKINNKRKRQRGQKPENLSGLFNNRSFRLAMTVNGIGWTMMAVAFYFALSREEKAPIPPQPQKIEQSVPLAPKTPAP